MPDDLGLNHVAGNSAKCSAVAAEGIQSNHINRFSPRFQPFNQLDQLAQPGVVEHHGIARPDALHEDGNFGHQHKIPILVEWVKTMTRDFDDLQQHGFAVRESGKRPLRRAYKAP